MTNITINAKNRTIEMNKTFAKAAAIFGSEEYRQLQEARRDYPSYRVITVKQKGAKPEYKGMDYKYMERYIAAHDDENGSIIVCPDCGAVILPEDEIDYEETIEILEDGKWIEQRTNNDDTDEDFE